MRNHEFKPKPLEEILDRRSGMGLNTRTAPVGERTGVSPGGTTYEGFVFSNPRVIHNLRRLKQAILDLGVDPSHFTFRVTGGDRYIDSDGNHRSATNHQIVPNRREYYAPR